MAFDYTAARATASAIIADFGAPGVITKKGTTGGFDGDGNVTADVADVTINGTVTPLIKYESHEIDGTKIIHNDGYVFFHSTAEPEVNMQITIDGKVLGIVSIYKLDSVGGVNVFRSLQLRA